MSYVVPTDDKGPYKVLISRGEFVDESRDVKNGGRVVPYKLYYPETDGKLPLIIWSHGLGGSRDGAAFLSRYISSHGYMVLHITHKGTDSSLWEGKPGHPWDAIRAAHISRKTTLERFKDVPFVLDQLSDQEWADAIDFDRLGMCGHSFGAITTQIMAGQKLGKGKRLYSLKEDRFKAGILYSPSFTYNKSEPHDGLFGDIDIPLLHMTGTEDDSPVQYFDYTHRLSIYDHAAANHDGVDQHLLVIRDADHMVFAGSRGKLGENEKRHIHEQIIKVTSLAYWDAYLKDDRDAYEWLSGAGYAEWLGDEGEYKCKA
jgi:dienelactone hydrolase